MQTKLATLYVARGARSSCSGNDSSHVWATAFAGGSLLADHASCSSGRAAEVIQPATSCCNEQGRQGRDCLGGLGRLQDCYSHRAITTQVPQVRCAQATKGRHSSPDHAVPCMVTRSMAVRILQKEIRAWLNRTRARRKPAPRRRRHIVDHQLNEEDEIGDSDSSDDDDKSDVVHLGASALSGDESA